MEADADGSALLLDLLGITSRAPPYAFDYLTARDRLQLLLVSLEVKEKLKHVEYHRCKDGRLYLVPFPGYPGLLETRDDDGLFPHQLASLLSMHKAENRSTDFGALRGGILGDAPGLGKTITLLALITSTAGKRPKPPPLPGLWNPQQLQEGWQTLSQNPSCDHDMNRVLKPFRSLKVYSSLARETRPPFSLTKFPTLNIFERHVRQVAKAHGATLQELEHFRQNIQVLMAGLHKSHRKVLQSAAGKRLAWERGLVPTSATLLIVPDALLEHWFQQIHQHLNRELFAENTWDGRGRGVVYLDGVGDIADARTPLGEVSSKQPMILQPWDLAQYMIVVTTFSRCKSEYQNEIELGNLGSGQKVPKKSSKKRSHPAATTNSRRRGKDNHDDDTDTTGSNKFHSSLLKMRWLRIVVDEGHELGTHESASGVTRFVHQMAAERRWVLSGTPTTGDEDDLDFSAKTLDQMQRLLFFLRHPQYGKQIFTEDTTQSPYVSRQDSRSRPNTKQQAKEEWTEKVKEPFLRKQQHGRDELLKVLRSVAVLHRKEDIHLPKPIFKNGEVNVQIPLEVQTNLQKHPVSSANLLQEYLRTDKFQELVDKAQGDYILEAIQKAKIELQERGGPLEVANPSSAMRMLSEEDDDLYTKSKDRRPIKAVVYSSNKFNLRDVTEALYSTLGFENIAEAYDDWNSGSELSRFRHNRKEIRRCPVCAYHNDFQGTSKEHRHTPKCQNFLLEVVQQGNESVRFLVETERIIRAVPVSQGGNVVLERLNGLEYNKYSMNRKAWREGDILEVNIMDPHPLLKKRESDEHWEEYGMKECMQKAERDSYGGHDWFFGPLPPHNGERTTRVILKKWQHCSKFHNHLRWYKGPRLSDVPLESVEENTFILALDAGLAHGLDLSFVTHIFLLEPVDDAALLEQITSRAHRLGATGPVTVETVNPYWKLDPATQAVVKASQELLQQRPSKTGKKEETGASGNIAFDKNDKSALTREVCQYCFRQFDSKEKAEAHEEKQCARNPENMDVVDPWHVSSVYREIRPPPPYTTQDAQHQR